ncbi:hypothetical protein F4780DRAFT_354642 [Xylariomycetidae sp. FL0641]|nr:hypothetical protein F4780DRAFT_354642 [Xylariomycetidae sp. FL0641]
MSSTTTHVCLCHVCWLAWALAGGVVALFVVVVQFSSKPVELGNRQPQGSQPVNQCSSVGYITIAPVWRRERHRDGITPRIQSGRSVQVPGKLGR